MLHARDVALDAARLIDILILFALLAAMVSTAGTVFARTPIRVSPITLVTCQASLGCVPFVRIGRLPRLQRGVIYATDGPCVSPSSRRDNASTGARSRASKEATLTLNSCGR